MAVQPYLHFDGRCAEALDYYRDALGAEITALMRFKDSPEPVTEGCSGPLVPEEVMHASFRLAGTEVMASDGIPKGQGGFKGVSLAVSVESDAETRRLFDALADGGQVQVPLTDTFFATSFGMVADRFGVTWMVLAPRTPG